MGAVGRPCKQEEQHIALINLNFAWTAKQVKNFRIWWQDGVSVEVIAKRFRRDPDEVAVLVMDQARVGAIEKRPCGAKGVGDC